MISSSRILHVLCNAHALTNLDNLAIEVSTSLVRKSSPFFVENLFLQQQGSSSSSNRFIEHDVSTRKLGPSSGIRPSFLNRPIYTYTRRRPEFPGRNVVFNKTIAGRRRTLLLNVKPARMSVKTFSFFECTFPLFFPFRLMLNKSVLRISMAKKKKLIWNSGICTGHCVAFIVRQSHLFDYISRRKKRTQRTTNKKKKKKKKKEKETSLQGVSFVNSWECQMLYWTKQNKVKQNMGVAVPSRASISSFWSSRCQTWEWRNFKFSRLIPPPPFLYIYII